MEATRCEHLKNISENACYVARIISIGGVEHHLCEQCYERLMVILLPDEPKGGVFFASSLTEPEASHTEPLTEPSSKTWKDHMMDEFRRQDPY